MLHSGMASFWSRRSPTTTLCERGKRATTLEGHRASVGSPVRVACLCTVDVGVGEDSVGVAVWAWVWAWVQGGAGWVASGWAGGRAGHLKRAVAAGEKGTKHRLS